MGKKPGILFESEEPERTALVLEVLEHSPLAQDRQYMISHGKSSGVVARRVTIR